MSDVDTIRENYFHSGSEEKINEGIKLLAEKHPLTEKLDLSFLDLKGTLDISPLINLTSLDLSCNLDLSKVIGLESPKKLENLNLIHTPSLTDLDVESLKEISHVVGLRDDFGVFLYHFSDYDYDYWNSSLKWHLSNTIGDENMIIDDVKLDGRWDDVKKEYYGKVYEVLIDEERFWENDFNDYRSNGTTTLVPEEIKEQTPKDNEILVILKTAYYNGRTFLYSFLYQQD